MAHVPIAQWKSDHDRLSHDNRIYRNPEDLCARSPYTPAMNTGSNSVERIDMEPQERLPHHLRDWSSVDGNSSQWQNMVQPPSQQSNVSFPLSMMSSIPGTQGSEQRRAATLNSSSSVDYRLSADPFMAMYAGSQIRTGYDPMCGYLGVQDFESKSTLQSNPWPSWMVPGNKSFTEAAKANTSDPENSSALPVSYSGMTRAADRVQLPTDRGWDGASTSNRSRQQHILAPLGIGGPSSITSLAPASSFWQVQPQQSAFTNDNSKLAPFGQHGFGAATQKFEPGANYGQHLLEDPHLDTKPSNAAHIFTDRVGLLSPVAPLAKSIPQVVDTVPKANPDTIIGHNDMGSLHPTGAWRHVRQIMPALEQRRGRLQPAQLADAHTERKTDDRILLEGKKKGLTYKDIARQMRRPCAESTLRGRYRSLTKARKDRVRKPVWREVDIELLKRRVQEDLHRIAVHHPSLKYEQRLSKVQWKNVASYIEENGGSYHFGNSTCKRKWTELHPTL